MSRDGAGNYTLPDAYNPVVSDTGIITDWANTTLQDLEAAMTDSLSRSGSGSMLAPLKLEDGSFPIPALTFDTQTTMGIYKGGTDDLRWTFNADMMRLRKVTDAGVLELWDGAAWSEVPDLSRDQTVTGNWTFEGGITTGITPAEGGLSSSVLKLTGEIGGPLDGQTFVQNYVYGEDPFSLTTRQIRRYEWKTTSGDVLNDIALLAYEPNAGGTDVDDAIGAVFRFKYSTRNLITVFNQQIGDPAYPDDPNTSPLVPYATAVYTDLFADGKTGTYLQAGAPGVSTPPSSAWFNKGADFIQPVRLWQENGTSENLIQFGIPVPGAVGGLEIGDFSSNYEISVSGAAPIWAFRQFSSISNVVNRNLMSFYSADGGLLMNPSVMLIDGDWGDPASNVGTWANYSAGDLLSGRDSYGVYRKMGHRDPGNIYVDGNVPSGSFQALVPDAPSVPYLVRETDANKVVIARTTTTQIPVSTLQTRGWTSFMNISPQTVEIIKDATYTDDFYLMEPGTGATITTKIVVQVGGVATLYSPEGTDAYFFGSGLSVT